MSKDDKVEIEQLAQRWTRKEIQAIAQDQAISYTKPLVELRKIDNANTDAAHQKYSEAIAAIFKDMATHIEKVENEILPQLLEQINDLTVRITMLEKPAENTPLGADGSDGVLMKDA